MKKFVQPIPVFAEHGSRAVVLLHAYSGSPNDVRMLCRFLEQSDYTVYTPMFAGHGTVNPQDILDESTEKWLADARSAITFLKERGYQEVAVLGLSMGGVVAMHLLTEKIAGVMGGGLFCSPIFPTDNRVPENFLKYAEKVLSFSDFDEMHQQSILASVPKQVEQQLVDISEMGMESAANLENIDVPVFLAQGGLDRMIDPKTVFQTAKELAHTRFTLQWYPNSGHVITVDVERKEFEKDVLAFLEGLSWSEETK